MLYFENWQRLQYLLYLKKKKQNKTNQTKNYWLIKNIGEVSLKYTKNQSTHESQK